jgi:thiol-disulfide isomerase/thioredoxin
MRTCFGEYTIAKFADAGRQNPIRYTKRFHDSHMSILNRIKKIQPEPAIIVALFSIAAVAAAQNKAVEPTALTHKIAEKYSSIKQYEFEGTFEFSRKAGEHPMDVLAKAKVKFAMAPGGKYLLRADDMGKSSFVVVSDGKQVWAYVPALKKYTVHEAAAAVPGEDPAEASQDQDQRSKEDIIDEFSRRVVPALARLSGTPANTFINGSVQIKYEGRAYAWPVLTVLSNTGEQANQSLMYLTVDPTSQAIGRMIWIKPVAGVSPKILLRLAIDFDSFHVGQPIPDSEFSFTPPAGTKKVEDLPLPGQDRSFLLNKPAPGFDLKTLDGRSVRLGELQGHPVLLNFWASWSEPCKTELPLLSKMAEEYKGKGLVVLGINQEGKDQAAAYAKGANLAFDSLDDSADKVGRLYRVRSVPTAVLINQKGTVVRVFLGAPDEKTLRAGLKNAGL